MTLIEDIIYDNSNRQKYFLGGLVSGFLLTILFTLGVASGMEFKDWYPNGKWDWGDWSCTVLGGIIGNLLQLLFISVLS